MRRLTNTQRANIKKIACLLLSVTMFLLALAATPYLARAIPNLSNAAAQNLLDTDSGVINNLPIFALGTGTLPPKTDQAPPIQELPQQNTDQEPNQSTKPQQKPTPNEDSLFVTPSNLCWYTQEELPALNIIDRTSYGVNLADYLSKPFPINTSITAKPLVLIVHTHGSESYLQNGYDFYSPNEDFRSEDESQTVVHIGDLLCQRLNALGIPAIQDKTMHDLPDYNQSYNNSLKAIKSLLAKYPTVQFVIDLHRDSVFDSKGNNVKPLTNINGKDCAQLMLVVGTNQMGIPHPSWKSNLTFATHLQQQINEDYPTLMRPINLRTEEFNQAQTKGSIILEVGSCGNTIEEAENAITLFANSYATLLKENLT
ncbi:MAG: stage II sporulation protein P [Clostridia bacterium]|nr:stage II sporulation protein P [Clostridia bacterium]